MGIGADKLRVNPRKPWYDNVEAVTTHGDYEVTFKLKRPQPALLALLASGWGWWPHRSTGRRATYQPRSHSEQATSRFASSSHKG